MVMMMRAALPYGRGSHLNSSAAIVTCGLLLLLLHCSSALSPHPLLLVVSFDGFWHGYLGIYRDVAPNLARLVRSGATAEYVTNQFITKTAPNHQSIATGLYEESHGIVANQFFDPRLNATFNLNDTDAKFWDTGAVPLWVLNQMQSPRRYSGGMMWPGTDALIRNQTAFYSVAYNTSAGAEDKIDVALGWFSDAARPANCVFLYFDEPDVTGHAYGPRSPETKRAVAEVDRLVGYLTRRMRDFELHDRLNVILTSDHGMAEIDTSNAIDIGLILNHSYAKYGGSPVWAVYPEPGKEAFVYETFKNATSRYNFSIYKKEEIPDRYHYRTNERIAPILLVAREGYDLLGSNASKHNASYGNHGYNNSVDSMHPFFVAYGPAFRPGARIAPFQNVDLYPLMCHILKLTPEPNNGTFTNVIHLLQDPFGVRVTGTWLIVICALLVICIVLAMAAAVFGGSKHSGVEPLEGNRFVYRTTKGGAAGGKPVEGEENTYLLVPTAVDEV